MMRTLDVSPLLSTTSESNSTDFGELAFVTKVLIRELEKAEFSSGYYQRYDNKEFDSNIGSHYQSNGTVGDSTRSLQEMSHYISCLLRLQPAMESLSVLPLAAAKSQLIPKFSVSETIDGSSQQPVSAWDFPTPPPRYVPASSGLLFVLSCPNLQSSPIPERRIIPLDRMLQTSVKSKSQQEHQGLSVSKSLDKDLCNSMSPP